MNPVVWEWITYVRGCVWMYVFNIHAYISCLCSLRAIKNSDTPLETTLSTQFLVSNGIFNKRNQNFTETWMILGLG